MKLKTQDIIIAGLLGAAAALLGLTPIGFIPFPTPAGHATTMHLPAIIAGILEGPVVGALVGFIFGLLSFTRATIPMFKDPIVAFLPRLFIGVVAYYAYKGMRNKKFAYFFATIVAVLSLTAFVYGVTQVGKMNFSSAKSWLTLVFPSLVAPLLLLLGAVALFYFVRKKGEEKLGVGVAAAAGTLTNTVGVLSLVVIRGYLPPVPALVVGVTHGIPEIILAIIIVVPVVFALKRAAKKE